ncbi:hypothetical protein [Phyllobacterium sp. K27]
MTLPASEETVPATDAEIEHYITACTKRRGMRVWQDQVVMELIARIRSETEDANIGRAIISAIGTEVADPTSPLHNWSPAEHYDEVITDLLEMVQTAREQAVRECAEIARKVSDYGHYYGEASVDTSHSIYQQGAFEVYDTILTLIDRSAKT